MVAMTDDDQGDGTTCERDVCQGCINAVQAVIDFDIGDGEEEFDHGFGDLVDDMHDALAALHRAYRERYTSKHDEIANTHEAAMKLVRIKNAVEHLIARGRELIE